MTRPGRDSGKPPFFGLSSPWRVVLLVAASMVVGAAVGGVFFYIYLARGRADLQPWHRLKPETEFDVSEMGTIVDFDNYLTLENDLFEEIGETLNNEVDQWPGLSRFDPSSSTNSKNFPKNWNRSYRLESDRPDAGALLLHGLSDSPYSLHAIAEHLQNRGVECIGLRLPGHGGVPGGLTSVRMEDWRAAVRIGVRAVRKDIGPTRPLILVGYSNGAALALDYALDAMNETDLPVPDRLIFFSPAFAVGKIAAFARWQRLFSVLPGMEKLAWTDILPEYDPFKFNSFPLRAGEEIYRLTSSLERKLQREEAAGRLDQLPPVLSFQSVIDATVPTEASLSRLYRRIKKSGSRLVFFDVDREAGSESFLTPEVDRLFDAIQNRGPWLFDVSIVANHSPKTERVELRTIKAGDLWEQFSVEDLEMEWPRGVFSLSHVALPFPPNDPVYGVGPKWRSPFPLGRIDPRGEKGALVVPLKLLMRLRYNPFFDIIPPMIDQFLSLEAIEKPDGS